MKPILQFFLVCLWAVMICSCEKNEADFSNMDAETVINAEQYDELDNNAPMTEVKIIGDDLYITITDGGCSGSRWKVKLIDSGRLAYSNPPQRFAKIEFVNDEECEALITRTFVFGLKTLRVTGSQSVSINLEGWPNQLLYSY